MPVGVELASFEGPEDHLYRSRAERVGSTVDHLELELSHMLSDPRAHMVTSPIKKANCVVLPARALDVQQFNQVQQEDQHHILIGVGLCQAIVNAAFRV